MTIEQKLKYIVSYVFLNTRGWKEGYHYGMAVKDPIIIEKPEYAYRIDEYYAEIKNFGFLEMPHLSDAIMTLIPKVTIYMKITNEPVTVKIRTDGNFQRYLNTVSTNVLITEILKKFYGPLFTVTIPHKDQYLKRYRAGVERVYRDYVLTPIRDDESYRLTVTNYIHKYLIPLARVEKRREKV